MSSKVFMFGGKLHLLVRVSVSYAHKGNTHRVE